MNRRLMIRMLGAILLVEALAMIPAALVGWYYGDINDALAMVKSIGVLVAVAFPAWKFAKPANKSLRAREGIVTVSLAWVALSFFGALPFVFSGFIPNIVDAFFESVSGFTTTGSTVVSNFDNYPHGVMFWRSFTHWIGGMGVLVLTLALLPSMTDRSSHLARAESPGPTFSKIVPKMGESAKILYIIYAALTIVNYAALRFAGMGIYDSAIHSMGTAGTGGFSNYALSVGAFDSVAIDVVLTVFMLIFGVNFALYYRVLVGGWREAIKSEELRWFVGLFSAAAIGVAVLILPSYGGSFWTALRYSSFQVSTLMSTTGYATADFNQWHVGAKMLLMLVMFTGSCAGSTAGGMKVIRVSILCKLARREIRHTFQPRKVQVVRFDGKGMDENTLSQIGVFFFVYILALLLGCTLISLEGLYDIETNFTAALTCLSNVGPGFGAVGPMGNFAGYGWFSKLVLSFMMLCGRLELFPMLILFHPAVYRKG